MISLLILLSFAFARDVNQQKINKELLQKSKKIEGIFNIYKYKDKYYLEIPVDKLNKEYFVSLQVSKGLSLYPFLGGLTIPVFEPLSDYTNVVYFSSKQIQQKSELSNGDLIDINLYVKNLKYRSSIDEPSKKMLDKSFSDNLVLKTYATYVDNSIYVDLNQFSSQLSLSFHHPLYSKQIEVNFNDLKNVKVYDKNMILYLSYLVTFRQYNRLFDYANSLNLTSNNEVIFALNVFDYKNDNYQVREYDDRVGYFATTYSDVSSTEGKDGGYRTIKKYINRWDLNNKKLTIWIENTWPVEYRETVKEAILEWNKAFNRIGYNDPIEVKIQPDDAEWEPEDIRYPTVRYQDANMTAFAIGPSIALPTTGEIVDADIVFYAPMLRLINSRFDYYYEVVLPSALKWQINPIYRVCNEIVFKDPKTGININQLYNFVWDTILNNENNYKDICTYPIEKMENAVIGLLSISLSNPTYYAVNKEKFAKDYIKDIIIHEVGHILGLRHNFKASSFVSIEQLQDESYTSKNGICYSCMDYNPVNIHYKNGKPYFTKDLFMTTIGYYDYLAIEYGYTRNESSLKQIASKCGIYYGPDEDIPVLDPNIRRFDLSSEGYRWYEDLSHVYKYVLENAPHKLSKVGNNPRLVYWSTRGAINAYTQVKLENIFYYLVGKNINRTFFGDNYRSNVQNLDPKLRDYVSNLVIKDLINEKPIITQSSLHNSIIFGSYEWGTTNVLTKTLLDSAYYNERMYRFLLMLFLFAPPSTKYEYYFGEDVFAKNLRKLYLALFNDVKFNKDLSLIRQQSIEDFVFLLIYLSGYSKFNNPSDVVMLNLLYLPNLRNESFSVLEKVKIKFENMKNSPLSTKVNKTFASRMLNFIEFYKDE
ncbi:MAG: zinc-dependent metalloprotease [Candidatus Calescibacterium sp.]|nr:zinc-dependent metalloprotease [Candidatus Calescibacterium sp.]MDW8132964.1 zinc-dependent metalloprotease [Candidatus Calescibacterium sp.]